MGFFTRKSQAPLETPSETPIDDAIEAPAVADDAATADLREAPASAAPQSTIAAHNPLVEAALDRWSTEKNAQTMFNVLRQCASGTLLLDVSDSVIADPQAGIAQGDTIAVAFTVDTTEKKLLLAFTSNEQLALHRGETTPISLVQSATAVMKQAISDYDGIVINAGSPETQCIAYAEEIRRGLTITPELNEKLKQALVERNLPWAELIEVLTASEAVFIATSETRDESGEITGISMPTVTDDNNNTFAVVFSSPAEVWAWAPGLNPRVTGIGNVARAALKDGLYGAVLNPAGQSIVLGQPELQRLS